MLLHDVQEAVALLGQRCGSLLGAARQLLEEIGDNVVQAGAAACANHGVCRNTTKRRCWGAASVFLAQMHLEPPNPERVSNLLSDTFTISNVPGLTAVRLLHPFPKLIYLLA